jgi:hypothetical protein
MTIKRVEELMMQDSDLIDYEKLRAFECALRLAIEQRTGADPGEVDGLALGSYTPIDAERACEILKNCYQD